MSEHSDIRNVFSAAVLAGTMSTESLPPRPIVPTRSPEKISVVSPLDTRYLNRPIEDVINSIGLPEGVDNQGDLICGPLSADVWNNSEYPNKPNLQLEPKKFWFLSPAQIDELLPQQYFDKQQINSNMAKTDLSKIEFKKGSFVYLSGTRTPRAGIVGHVVVVADISATGEAFAYTNEEDPQTRKATIKKVELRQQIRDWAIKRKFGTRFMLLWSPK